MQIPSDTVYTKYQEVDLEQRDKVSFSCNLNEIAPGLLQWVKVDYEGLLPKSKDKADKHGMV